MIKHGLTSSQTQYRLTGPDTEKLR